MIFNIIQASKQASKLTTKDPPLSNFLSLFLTFFHHIYN